MNANGAHRRLQGKVRLLHTRDLLKHSATLGPQHHNHRPRTTVEEPDDGNGVDGSHCGSKGGGRKQPPSPSSPLSCARHKPIDLLHVDLDFEDLSNFR